MKTSNESSIIENITAIRCLLGISQQQMADQLCCSLATYGKMEREEVELTISKLEKICDIFQITIKQLVSFNELEFKKRLIKHFDLFVN